MGLPHASCQLGYNQILDIGHCFMAQIALHPWLHIAEARTGTYNGVETALSFGDPAAELETLCTGCGVFAVAWRGRINVNGKDRVRWLHNMVTNNVRD